MTKKEREAYKQSALEDLKEEIHEGDTIYTVLRHRSASGMYRAIDCYVFLPHGMDTAEGKRINFTSVRKLRYTWSIATALGYRYDKKHEAIGISGCGFDAAYQIIDDLSHALFGVSGKLKKEEI